jgi:hypothetical protein
MKTEYYWNDQASKNKVEGFKKLLVYLSLYERKKQLALFMRQFSPSNHANILDVGFSTNEEQLIDTNFFEKSYPFKEQITAFTVEDLGTAPQRYPNIKMVKGVPHQPLPFADNEFEFATSWAVLEHAGDYSEQEFFLNEIFRVAKTVFITTPYRACFFEPHTGVVFLHCLSHRLFRAYLRLTGKLIWSDPKNLNLLFISDLKRMKLNTKIDVKIHFTLGFIPSHLIITKAEG